MKLQITSMVWIEDFSSQTSLAFLQLKKKVEELVSVLIVFVVIQKIQPLNAVLAVCFFGWGGVGGALVNPLLQHYLCLHALIT